MRHCVFRADFQIYAGVGVGGGKTQNILFPEIVIFFIPLPPSPLMFVIFYNFDDTVGDLSFHKVNRIVTHCIVHKDFSGVC